MQRCRGAERRDAGSHTRKCFPCRAGFQDRATRGATRCGMHALHALHGARRVQPVEIESKLVELHSSWPCWSLLQYILELPRPRQDRAGPIYVGHLDVASCHLLLFDKDPAVRDRGLNVVQSGLPLTP